MPPTLTHHNIPCEATTNSGHCLTLECIDTDEEEGFLQDGIDVPMHTSPRSEKMTQLYNQVLKLNSKEQWQQLYEVSK